MTMDTRGFAITTEEPSETAGLPELSRSLCRFAVAFPGMGRTPSARGFATRLRGSRAPGGCKSEAEAIEPHGGTFGLHPLSQPCNRSRPVEQFAPLSQPAL